MGKPRGHSMPFQHTTEDTNSTPVILTYDTHDADTLQQETRTIPTTAKDVSKFIIDTASGNDPDNQWDSFTVERMILGEGLTTTLVWIRNLRKTLDKAEEKIKYERTTPEEILEKVVRETVLTGIRVVDVLGIE
jgi:hypothetical protein